MNKYQPWTSDRENIVTAEVNRLMDGYAPCGCNDYLAHTTCEFDEDVMQAFFKRLHAAAA